ncbi:DUF3307 domain-containing protein [Chryseobacterium carnipullorum]|uniref:DUF3307 domain-containing protein n=1 Tax=Chryseobacterium carnipullorum TaxID=1124835 RepID=A0A376E054_CHRCU|nr:DUF3307 domain-containing protein [Chryseobacterium carnipullorum]AZA50224.1 DUF3307 domain-containing protein [Chryseobacterium carnipullorum]AZA65096.1 DUF3307 domain-containing protein [Chryseobacterium carnipullorum]STC97887.1 Protein of uncharacterised function (DUF3307) [Chryseobacterium carnipullorum]
MIFTKLILAHLLGDFVLQPNSWVADKERRKLKSPYLYLHVLIHTVLSFVFLWNTDLWWVSLVIGATHFIIDASKLIFQNVKNKKAWFFIDQLLHILVILGISFYFKEFNFDFLSNKDFLKILMAALFLTTPASIFIKILLSSWTPVPETQSSLQTESLSSAGKYIGILERLLVFTFIMVNHWEGVGFMVAAKSVFRFSDLAQAKQRKLTEYVLIGTLLSFGLAVLTGILIK